MITKYLKQNILETELEHIAHGVNCMNVMGSGIAKVLYEKYPLVKKAYHSKWDTQEKQWAGWRLGESQYVLCDDKTIINMFTQIDYLPRNVRNVNYWAIGHCFRNLRVEKIAIPKIGCGLAGGDWSIVEQIINDATEDRVEVWVYEI